MKTWTDKTGKIWELKDMSTEHLVKVSKLLEAHNFIIGTIKKPLWNDVDRFEIVSITDKELYNDILKELKNREKSND